MPVATSPSPPEQISLPQVEPGAERAEPDPAEEDRIGPFQMLEPEAVADSEAADFPVETTMVASPGGITARVRTAGVVHGVAAARAASTGERLIGRLRLGIHPGMEPAVQKEAAALIALITDLVAQEFNEFFCEIDLAITALLSDPPNLTLASRIRTHVRRRTNLFLRPLLFLRSGHPAIQVILGLGTILYLAIPLAVFLLPQWLRGGASGIPDHLQNTLLWVGVAGAIGSVVSILVRIRDFDNQQAEHRSILFFTGFFKPVVGVASALFVVSLFEAGIITLQLAGPTHEQFFYVALAFVAGFSERLAEDLVSKAEKQIVSAPAPATRG
jgi:hypothetical protein